MSDTHSGTIVIGVGALERGDDAVGLLVARQLRERENDGLRVVESDGNATELIDLLGTVTHAIIVDAADFGGPGGEVRRIDAIRETVPQTLASFSSHDFGVAQGIEMARALGELPGQCTIYAIQGERFDHGVALSHPVRAAIDKVVGQVTHDLARESG